LRRIFLFLMIILFSVNSYADVETEPNSTMETADSLISGTSMKAHIMSETDEDWYSITVTGPDVFEVNFFSEYYEIYVTSTKYYQFEVQDSQGNILVNFEIERSVNTGQTYNVGVSEAGTFYFIVKPAKAVVTKFYEITVTATNISPGCIGECSAENLQAEYNSGYANGLAVGCSGMYTQDEVDRIVGDILTWGDTNGDNKIGLTEAINALQVTAGAKPLK